ncbi:Protein ninG [Pseudomonas reidholzensis]|uniref:Protein ninG n=1 Tax=Pseudomonas reidholzensis TaxID=1785162 RepID=A0A383RST9_9PSED|nr:recombination protein NinG [Pseudomonas reidholzensis]SYX89945.1 Protein ninG [Pseudomonas reidholzensis]
MRVALKEVKQKTCKACGGKFRPSLSTQKACGVKCALELAKKPENQQVARKAIAQRDRREIQVRKEKLKSRSEHMREAQALFNELIRLRDASQPCISCDSLPSDHDLITGSRWDAGHYRSVGACPELRFEPLNVHRQCVKCNRNLSGNAVEYRIRLVRRIGADKVDWLEGPHQARKYTIEDLKALKTECRAKIKQLKEQAA